jgi:KipI family sensor histidine kinase inhibitor
MLELGGAISLESQRRIWWLSERLRARAGVREVVPGMNNLSVELDPTAPDPDALLSELEAAWNASSEILPPSREIEIQVRYGGEEGCDLEEVARHTGFSAEEVVRLHSSAEYTVYFLGFLPGFAYLGGLDARLETPRRKVPRTAVPAGSVGIGGDQTGIYPLLSPGGWQLIGRTSAPLFDPAATPSALLRPGDRVRFVPSSVLHRTDDAHRRVV